MESSSVSSESIFRPPPDSNQFVTAIHGNCVFSDAEHPVRIDHLASGAVVSPVDGAHDGVIHFTLPFALDSNLQDRRNLGFLGRTGLLGRLEVDFVQVQRSQGIGRPSEIIKAEIYVGCAQYWSSEVDKDASFAVQVKGAIGTLDLNQPKGFGVTLTIKFKGDSLRFCSVALSGAILGGSIGPPRPGEQ